MSIIIESSSRRDIRPSDIASESDYLQRREFIKKSGVMFGASLIGGVIGSAAANAGENSNVFSGLTRTVYEKNEQLNTYEEATAYNKFYEFGVEKEDPARRAKIFVTDSRPQLPIELAYRNAYCPDVLCISALV